MLNNPVKEIMTSPVVTVRADASMKSVVQLLEQKDFSGLPVVDDQDRVIGVISERDMLKYTRWIIGRPLRDLSNLLEHNSDATSVESQRGAEMIELVSSREAGTIMTPEVITINEDAPVLDAVKCMNRQGINRIPVVDDQQKLQGIVTRANVISMIERWAENY